MEAHNHYSLESAIRYLGKIQESEAQILYKNSQLLFDSLGLDPKQLEDQLLLPMQWLYHPEWVRPEEIGRDGHPKVGLFMPPLPAKRRMFVGSTMNIHRPIAWGAQVKRVRKIIDIDKKQGRAGEFYLVKVKGEFTDLEGLLLEETQTIAYLDSWGGGRAAVKSEAKSDPKPEFTATLLPDSVMLFRFSALTFNGHKIHYDLTYARENEKYPDIVIHGPLSAMMLGYYAKIWLGKNIEKFTFRMITPLFLGEEMRFEGKMLAQNQIEIWVRAPDGQIAVSARAS